MADKIENKQVAEKQQDNGLSNLAFELMKGAALGGVGGALMNKEVRDAAANGIARGVVEGANAAIQAQKAIENAAAGAAAGAAGVAVGAGAAKLGKELIKENKNEINKGAKAAGDGAKAIENEVKRQAKEIMDTPKDVIDHVQKRPVTSIVEGMIGGPGAVILDAKLRKWFGDK